MRNIVLCGINARYSHSSLALLCLKHAAEQQVKTIEFSINDSVSSITDAIVKTRPDAACFSCYIWNIEHVLKAASSLKRILPDCFILLGGPEVSFCCEELMRRHDFIDMIIRGPGEIPFARFTELFGSGDVSYTPSACIRSGGGIIATPDAPPYNLEGRPFMYGDISQYENKVIYYETSRGCPFKCAYCMSANEPFSSLPEERVKEELEHFIRSNVRQVKLVDRTFNYPPGRAYEIIKALIELSEKYPDSRTNFHLEITASLMDDKLLSLLRRAKKGLLRLEVGIQSTNPETLKAVNRSADTKKLLENAHALCEMPNVLIHADLITGLPLESYESFKKSFNDAYSLTPDELQLGFLKILKGSPIHGVAQKYGIVYTEYPPYEVLYTNDISYDELSRLHIIEQVLDRLYNSRLCLSFLKAMVPSFPSPFDFYECLSLFLEREGFFSRPQKTKSLFEALHKFAVSRGLERPAVDEALLLDWLYTGKPYDYPSFVENAGEPERLRAFLSDVQNISAYLPHYAKLAPRDIARRCHIHTFRALFPGKTLLFDYGKTRDEEGFCQAVE